MATRGKAAESALPGLAESHRRSAALMNSGQPAAAARELKSLLRKLARIGPSTEATTLRVRVMITLAKVDLELRGTSAGIRRLDEAVQLLPGADDELRTTIHNQRGVLLLRSGQFETSIAEFDEGERWFGSATPLDRANILLNRSTALMMTGALRRAARDLEQLTALAHVHRTDGLDRFAYMAPHNHGYLRYLLGDLPKALELMAEAAELATS